MELNITIQTGESCEFKVIDNSTYLDEGSEEIIANQFKFKDTVKIYTIYKNTLEESTIIKTLTEYLESNKEYSIPIDFDGWFTFVYMVIPTKEYVETNKETIQSYYDNIYCSDGIDLYKYSEEQFTKITLEELIEINPERTTISKCVENLFSLCYLKNCYINLCKQLFDKRGFSKCYTFNEDYQLIYNRDLIWMTINVISYLIELGDFNEAQRIIELFNECNNICKSINQSGFTRRNCNCS